MPKPIIITDDMKIKVCEEFAEMIAKLKMADGKISYTKAFKYIEASATLSISQLAYKKMVTLVTSFTDEVAWHGTVTRASKSEFMVEDILVYPQEVTGSPVNTDLGKYTDWLYGLEDEDFNKIRFQAHSHVNMGVSPSGVDDAHRTEILGQLDDDMFYIFMIWNKRLETHTLIYDMANNVLYENDDVVVKITGDEVMDEFLSGAKKYVQKKQPKQTKYRVKQSEKRPPSYQRSLWDHSCGFGDDPLGLNENERAYLNEYT